MTDSTPDARSRGRRILGWCAAAAGATAFLFFVYLGLTWDLRAAEVEPPAAFESARVSRGPLYERVIATGTMMSVDEFCQRAFACVGLDSRDYVEIDPRYFRPPEVEQLLGDASKARSRLGWEPKTTVEELVRMMIDGDLELAAREKTLRDAGHDVPATVGHDQ